MPELLIICEHPTLLGGEHSMLSVIGAVEDAGFSVSIMAPPEGSLAEVCMLRGLHLVPLLTQDFSGKTLPQSNRREYIAAQLAHLRPDLVHANSLAMARLVGPVAKELGLVSIGHLRDIIKLSRRAVDDIACCTRLLAVSQATRDYHVAAGLPADNTHVLYNGIDLYHFMPRGSGGELHCELNLPHQAVLIGAIGQISLRKGQDTLLTAASLLAAELPDVHYVLVGRRWSDKDEARRFEADLHTTARRIGNVHFLGERDDVPLILDELTILVHPARQEPLGRVLLEAAASGLPIVATDVGGTREIFDIEPDADLHTARETALLVPPDEPDAMAAMIAELMRDQELRKQLGQAARKRAEDAFDVRVAAANLIEHYRAVISG
ncbi:MAG: glycosyltransferase family 4 protein [Pirellulales bacterium]|nr:glycosyltransferase family 4 protein [Pirellulales bacterium]